MPVKLAALPIASSGSVPVSTTIVPVRVLFFQRDARAIERGKGRAFGQIILFHRAKSFSFTNRLRLA